MTGKAVVLAPPKLADNLADLSKRRASLP